MAENIFTALPNKEKIESQGDMSLCQKEQQLRGAVRFLMAEKMSLQAPLLAAKRLAKYCQNLKNENERLKQRAYNFEMGMVRAERRTAQLQHDLGKAQTNKPSSDKNPAPKQFFMPSSIQLLVDSLTTQNVIFMKALNKATDHPRGAELKEKTLRLEEKVSALQDEIASKTETINSYESLLGEPKSSSEELARSIIDQRKECSELKTKLKTYTHYVRHLREKNTAIMQSVMDDFDKRKLGPSESGDIDDEIVSDGGATQSASSDGTCNNCRSMCNSQNSSCSTSRRTSLKSSDVDNGINLIYKQHAESQTDCASAVGSFDEDVEEPDLHKHCMEETLELKEVISEQTNTLNHKLALEQTLKEALSERQQAHETMCLEINIKDATVNSITEELQRSNERKKELELMHNDLEQTLAIMQDHIDTVNSGGGADVDNLRQELYRCKEQLTEYDLMQLTLKNYEDDIKAYGRERQEIIKKNEELEIMLKKEKTQKEQLQDQLKSKPTQPPSPANRTMNQPQNQRRQQSQRHMMEPHQNQQWFYGQHQGLGVVQDGSSKRVSDGSPTKRFTDQEHYANQERHTGQERNTGQERYTNQERNTGQERHTGQERNTGQERYTNQERNTGQERHTGQERYSGQERYTNQERNTGQERNQERNTGQERNQERNTGQERYSGQERHTGQERYSGQERYGVMARQNSLSPMHDAGHLTQDAGLTREEIQDNNDYIENGIVKCENCDQRFPSIFFQDHFRDCSRNKSD